MYRAADKKRRMNSKIELIEKVAQHGQCSIAETVNMRRGGMAKKSMMGEAADAVKSVAGAALGAAAVAGYLRQRAGHV